VTPNLGLKVFEDFGVHSVSFRYRLCRCHRCLMTSSERWLACIGQVSGGSLGEGINFVKILGVVPVRVEILGEEGLAFAVCAALVSEPSKHPMRCLIVIGDGRF